MAGPRNSRTSDAPMRLIEPNGGDESFSLSRPSLVEQCLAKRINDHHLASLSATAISSMVAEDSPLIMRSRIT